MVLRHWLRHDETPETRNERRSGIRMPRNRESTPKPIGLNPISSSAVGRLRGRYVQCDGDDILPPFATIGDFIHQGADEMHTAATDGPVFPPRRRIRLGDAERIKG